MRRLLLLGVLLVLANPVLAQNNYVVDDTATGTVPENGVGPARMSPNKIQYTNPTNNAGTALFPSAFASADNLAAQTATFMHGGMMAWDVSAGGEWDRLRMANGMLNINISGATITIPFDLQQLASQTLATPFDLDTGGGTQRIIGFTWRKAASGGSVEFGTSSDPVRVDPTGTTPQPITAASLPLPTGAATEASVDGLEGSIGTTTDAAATPGGTGSLSAKLRNATDLLNQLLTELGQKTEPANAQTTNVTQWNSVALGSPSAYGSSPGAVNVPGVNAFITNTPSVNVNTFPDNEPFNVAQYGGSTVGAANAFHVQPGTGAVFTNQGNLADDGAAAATNRIGTLPSIAQSGYNPSTAGRNTANNTGAGDGLLMAAALPSTAIPSYSASAVVSSAASATDIAILPGNATNTVLVTEVRVSCTQSTAGQVQLHLIKRSTANSGGTSAGMTEVPDDANYAAASSAALTYTANPTPGTSVGDIDIVKLGCMATGTAAPNDIYIANFRQKPIVLRGTAQGLSVNLNGATVSGGSFTITYKFMEVTGL